MNELAASTLPFLQTLADARIPAVTSILNVITVMGDEKLFVVISMIIAWCVSKRGGQYMLTVGFGLSNVGQTLKMIFRVSSGTEKAGAYSTTFWCRRCTEQSRSNRCTTLP